jgi:hypothetical protein
MRAAVWRQCTSDAHRNIHIDHCWTCAPYWEAFPGCPDCGDKLRAPRRGHRPNATPRARCINTACASVRRWFDLSNLGDKP